MDKAKTLTATAIFSLLLVRVLAGSHMDSDLLYPDPTPKPARQPDIILAQAMATPEPGATGTKPGSIKAPHANVTPGHVTLLHTPEKSSTSKTSRTALNPQPLPPLKSGKPATGNSTSKTSRTALNPQPLPPLKSGKPATSNSTSKTSRTALNPQPLPPLKSGKPATGNSTSKTSKNKLNPQPLPP